MSGKTLEDVFRAIDIELHSSNFVIEQRSREIGYKIMTGQECDWYVSSGKQYLQTKNALVEFRQQLVRWADWKETQNVQA